jgi:fatty-acyl-CoA synthase
MSTPLNVREEVPSQKGLFSWLNDVAVANPDRLVARGLEGDDIVDITLAELESKSRRLSKGLLSIGLRSGDTIGSWLPNRVEWIVTEFACAAIGVSQLGLNTRYRSHEIAHLLKTVRLSAIVLPSTFLDIDLLASSSWRWVIRAQVPRHQLRPN